MWTSFELKTRAKDALTTSYWKSLLVMLICWFVSAGGSRLTVNANMTELQDAGDIYKLMEVISKNMGMVLGIMTTSAVIAAMFSIFISAPLSVGQLRFFNEAARDRARIEEVAFSFSKGLKPYLNIVKIMFFKSLYLFLWGMIAWIPASALIAVFMVMHAGGMDADPIVMCLLPVIVIGLMIPVIVKSYQYIMIDYILTDQPEISLSEAFAKTKKMTDGNKWKIFILHMSFIGWIIIGIIPFGIGLFFVSPYISATFSQLYLELCGKENYLEE